MPSQTLPLPFFYGMNHLSHAIRVESGALLVTAPAATPVAELNAALAPYALCLPIFPLRYGLSLADLVACNSGGRRRLRHGLIGRYLRAALLDCPAGPPLLLGGPTLKWATGYGLQRALAGGALQLGTLRELSLSLRPLPAARQPFLLQTPSPAAACTLAAQLAAAGLALSALAFAENAEGAGLLLAELESLPPVVARQALQLADITAAAGATRLNEPEPWVRWQALAAAHTAPGVAGLDLCLPRAALPALVEHVAGLARRYSLPCTLWGEAGVGNLYLTCAGPPDERHQFLAIIEQLAHAVGGAPSTEFKPGAPAWSALARTEPPSHKQRPHLAHNELLAALRAVVGPNYLLTHPDQLLVYERDASLARPTGSALAVALPASTTEVAALVRLAAAHGVPLIARGAGSGLAGGSTPTAGALIIALNRLDSLRIDRLQMQAHVGAGMITASLQRAAEEVGLFYPPDPSSQSTSTIGGNLACNAGGPRCLKYGVTADYLLGLTAVLADGQVVHWGDGLAGQGPSNGLAQLLVGSEGTLGLITEATMRLIPAPATRRTTTALFANLEAACTTVEQIMGAGLVPAGLELLDDACIAAVEAYLQLGLPRESGAMLLMLADGEPEAVEAEVAALAALARAGGASEVQVAASATDEARLWQARRAVSIALARIRPNRLGEDICVPLVQIAACVRRIKQVSAEYGLPIVVFGHAGDGNLHPNILFDAHDPAETARLWPCAEAVFAAALAVGGTLSGEHGIGTLKRPLMQRALGEASLALQIRIKAWLDPDGLLNPGKILP